MRDNLKRAKELKTRINPEEGYLTSFWHYKRRKSKKLQREDYFDLPTGGGEKGRKMKTTKQKKDSHLVSYFLNLE